MTIYDLLFLVNLFVMFFGLYRNYWVFKKRSRVNRYMKGFGRDLSPSYNTMMLKFWIWDINKFLK